MEDTMVEKELIRTFFEAVNIPVCLFSGTDLLEKASHPTQDFNLPLILFAGIEKPLPPAFYGFTPEFLYFGGVCIPGTDEVLFLGPVLRFPCSMRQARQICSRLGRPAASGTEIQEYLNYTGGRQVSSILSGIRLFCRLIRIPDPEEITAVSFRWEIPYPIKAYPSVDTPPEEAVNLDHLLMSSLRFGNTQDLKEIIAKYFSSSSYQPAAIPSAHRKYILGALVRFTHETIEAGVNADTATGMMYRYIDQIMNSDTSSDISDVFFRMLTDFTQEVAKLRDLPSGSPVVKYIHDYIYNHLDEKLSPHFFAEKLNMNCSYLCTFFKKETGMTIIHYVQSEKIKAARQLLTVSDLSLVEISEFLAFSSQSYFGKVFRKYTGMTPEEYRASSGTAKVPQPV